MTREEAITRLHWLKRELIKGTDMNEPIDMAIEALQREEAEEKGYCHRIKPKEYFSADAVPTVIRSKTLLPTKDFKEWAKRIKEVNPNAVVIPCDAEVASADAIHSGGVFVPNMEMPKVCDYCLFHDSEWSWCKAKDKYCGDGKCPLIAVRDERREL